MKTFIVKISYETKIKADTKEKAIDLFWKNDVYETQCDPTSFIDENLLIKEE